MRMDVIARLGQAAARRSLEKRAAGRLGAFFGGLRSLGGRAASAVTAPVRYGAQAARTAFGSPRRALATAALGTGGYLAGRNMYEDAYYNHQSGFSLNPFRAFGLGGVAPGSHEEAFRRNTARFNELADPVEQEMNAAAARGDHAGADRLRRQLVSGNIGGGRHALAPWTWGRGVGGSYAQGSAGRAQGALQSEYDRAMGNARPGDAAAYDSLMAQLDRPGLLPQQARLLQQQAAQIRGRLENPSGMESAAAEAIRRRMEGSPNDPNTRMRVVRPPVEASRMRQAFLGGRPGGIVPYDRGVDWGIYATTSPHLHPEGLNPRIQTWG